MSPRFYVFVAILMAAVAAAPPLASDEPLVVVNGEAINRDALIHRVLDLSTAGVSQLEEMVNETLLSQAAKKQNLSATDAEIDARIADIKKRQGSDDAFARYLAGEEVTAAGLRQKIRVRILVEKLLADKANVTDAEVKDTYDQNKASFESPETVTLRMILTKTKERADQAMKRLDANESFADVAKALSEETYTAGKGGLLPAPVARGNLSAALADAAWATEVGKYSKPVQTPDGYYILKVEARSAASSRGFDEVKELIRAQLREMKIRQAWMTWLGDARKGATIERKWQP
jgi:foldase protein PrsA